MCLRPCMLFTHSSKNLYKQPGDNVSQPLHVVHPLQQNSAWTPRWRCVSGPGCCSPTPASHTLCLAASPSAQTLQLGDVSQHLCCSPTPAMCIAMQAVLCLTQEPIKVQLTSFQGWTSVNVVFCTQPQLSIDIFARVMNTLYNYMTTV